MEVKTIVTETSVADKSKVKTERKPQRLKGQFTQSNLKAESNLNNIRLYKIRCQVVPLGTFILLNGQWDISAHHLL